MRSPGPLTSAATLPRESNIVQRVGESRTLLLGRERQLDTLRLCADALRLLRKLDEAATVQAAIEQEAADLAAAWTAYYADLSTEELREVVAADAEEAEQALTLGVKITDAIEKGSHDPDVKRQAAESRDRLRRERAELRKESRIALTGRSRPTSPVLRRTAPRARGAGSPAGRAIARSTSRGGDSGDDDSGSSEGDGDDPPGALEEKFGRSLFHRLARWLARRAA